MSDTGVRLRRPQGAGPASSPGGGHAKSHPLLRDVDASLSSELYRRRAQRRDDGLPGVADLLCARCREPFGAEEQIVNAGNEAWHQACFVCAQCFRPFPEGVYYQFGGRNYCETDFRVLYSPCCNQCGNFIVGRVIRALNASWHPSCFLCKLCKKELADEGFIKLHGSAVCRGCYTNQKGSRVSRHICYKCSGFVDGRPVRYKGEIYHPYHFNCCVCGVELSADARELKAELYCLRCHDKQGVPICGACRRPVEKRVVRALGKTWHPEHFVCAKCEKPFLGSRHYEQKGQAYCPMHYHLLFGNLCVVCDGVITGDVFNALNKSWCVEHFACSQCDRSLSQKAKFFEVDMKPVCKSCYEKMPADMKKSLKRYHDLTKAGLINPKE